MLAWGSKVTTNQNLTKIKHKKGKQNAQGLLEALNIEGGERERGELQWDRTWIIIQEKNDSKLMLA